MAVHRAKPVLLLPSFIGVLLLWCLLSGSVLDVTGQEKEEENEGKTSVIGPTKAAPTILSSLVKAEMSRQVQAVLGNITRVHTLDVATDGHAYCKMVILSPFSLFAGPARISHPGDITLKQMAAVALALQHLNARDGRIIPELASIPPQCNIQFTSEFVDTGR
jgi:hypothetical protein